MKPSLKSVEAREANVTVSTQPFAAAVDEASCSISRESDVHRTLLSDQVSSTSLEYTFPQID